MLDNTD